MSFIASMQQRYTTKKYDPSKKISAQHIEELKQIARLSPSSLNSQPWKFTFVSDAATKQKLSKVSWINTAKVIDCDTLVVFSRINDLQLFEENIEKELPKGAVDYYKEYIKPLSEENIKVWFDKQVYLAVGVFLSACAEMGIDSTPMEGVEPENYDKILGQKDHATLMAIAIGYRSDDDANQPSKKPKSRRDMDDVVASV